MADQLLQQQTVMVAINGTEKLDEGRFQWSMTEVASTHHAVQRALDKLAKTVKINRNNIVLMGFSLGAQHSAHLLASYPKAYAGAFIISPGGPLDVISSPPPKDKRIVILYGAQEHADNIKMSKDFTRFFEQGSIVTSVTHQGAHHFADNWQDSYPTYLRSILDKTSNSTN